MVIANQNSVNVNVTLKRIVGPLSVELGDQLPIPSWVDNIAMSFGTIKDYYHPFHEKQEWLPVFPFPTKRKIMYYSNAEHDLKFHPLYTFGLPEGSTATLTITVKDASGNAVITKVVDGISIFTNKKTIIRGNLLDVNGSFNIDVDYEWADDEVIIDF